LGLLPLHGAEFGGVEQSQMCPQLAIPEFAIRNVNVVDACHFFKRYPIFYYLLV
jgi:hypothetical protein